jgi:hypothetical protein
LYSNTFEFGLANVALIYRENTVPAIPEIIAKNKYSVPISL